MSNTDQFNMARIPIRLLSYKDKELAETKELLIDNIADGDNEPTYHMYIVDDKDRTILIDLTEMIIKEAFPTLNADNFNISIEGLLDPQKLKDIINDIYKHFLFPEDENGFDYEEDYEKIIDPNTKSVLLTNKNGNIFLPITTTANIFDSTGSTLEDRLNNMSKVGFSTGYVRAENNGQSVFDFDYPFPDYLELGNFIEVRIGSVIIEKSRYEITEKSRSSDGHVYGASIRLLDQGLEINRAVNLLFIYNSADIGNGGTQGIYGGLLANGSVSTMKLEKVSDRYDLPDSTSIATSQALCNLYNYILSSGAGSGGEGSSGVVSNVKNLKIQTNRFVKTTQEDKENNNTISYNGLSMSNYNTDELFVYRNGIRLFENLDYSINRNNKTITVYVNIEKFETFVFETQTIVASS